MTVTIPTENDQPQIEDLALHPRPARNFSGVTGETTTASAKVHSFLPLLLLAGLVVLAAIVRIIATHNDLWLDELFSLYIVKLLRTPWQIFTAVHNDNNHYLNTLYLYLVRNHDYPPPYRWLSVMCGVALVPAGYWLLARRSQLEAVILSGLLTCSYPLIHFSSEARGYSGALLGSMLACAALTRWMAPENGKRRSFLLGSVYAMALVLAILSHLTACLIWFALAGGSLLMIAGRPVAGSRRMKRMLYWIALNALPAVVLALLYFFDLRFLTELGGNPMSLPHALGRLFALALGWPGSGAVTVWIVAAPFIVLIVRRLVKEEKSGEPLAILLVWIYLTPLICILVLQTIFFSSRYFLVLLPFLYASAAMVLARLLRTRAGRVISIALCALFLAGQGHLYWKFLRVGRGQFTASLQYIVKHTQSPRIIVASDQYFRSRIELGYYGPRVAGGRQLLYVRGTASSVKPDWYILHQEGYESQGPAELHIAGQPTWYRAAYFGASELSGQAWTIYSHRPVE